MAGASATFLRQYKNNSSTVDDLPSASAGFAFAFVADDTTAAFTAVPTPQTFDGALAGVGAKFSGTTPPDSLTITISDALGITVAAGTLAASGYITLDRPMFFVPGPLTIALTGNTTASAACTIALVFA